MPTEIRKIDVTVNAMALKERPELATHIAIISSLWAEIEDQLAVLFIAAIQTEPAIAAAILGNAFSVDVKLKMIRTAMVLRFPKRAVKPFGEIAENIKSVAGERNQIVHSIWSVHKDHPNALVRIKGITDPILRIEKYVSRDFLETEIRLVQQLIDLKQFVQSLSPYLKAQERGRRERFWRVSSHPPAKDESARLRRQRVSAKPARSKRPRSKRGRSSG